MQIFLLLANYTTLCSIDYDLSSLSLEKRLKHGRHGDRFGTFYYVTEYDIVLLFGLTELKAQIAWMEGVSGLSIYIREKDESLIKLVFGYTGCRKKVRIIFVGPRCGFHILS
jgi:hypothetical protein